ncbi:MAG: outer membrane protein assembly factor BamB family protein [Planctomycetota bacterium]|jgi:outer membrane protein assembly factor BamB
MLTVREVLLSRGLLTSLILLVGWSVAMERADAADWPMYRQDAGRRGATTESLPDNLTLAWVRHLPAPTPAYNDNRLQFDAGYEPVVAEGVLLLASSRTDSVKAYDAKTGRALWSFVTNGPVRCAPAIWGGVACFGSDDGFLYAVELKTGALRWKLRAAPSGRRLLGNERLISVWPVRGGPVVADGRVYFAAGVWPFEGVFIYAMDVATGRVIWRNDRLGYLFGKQPHNTQAIGGLAPQGYLLINGDELIVPCSNAYPARLNRHTGELIEFELPSLGKYPGGWFAALDPDTARALRHGRLTFDEIVNQREHEGGMKEGSGGVEGLSREIRVADHTLKFDDPLGGVEGTVHSMAVASGALFVSMRDGRVMCFRRAAASLGTPTVWGHEMLRPPLDAETRTLAEAILSVAPGSHGYAIVAGLKDGAITKALVEESAYHVIAIDDAPARVTRLRNELTQAGLYGRRASVILDDPKNLTLPPYIATVLLSERDDIALAPLLQTLRPYGGIAVGGAISRKDLSAATPGRFELTPNRVAGLNLTQRVGPLPGAAEYAGDFSLSPDELVRFPLGVLWYDDALSHFKRSPQPVFDRGTMVSRPKDWRLERYKESNKIDYPLLPPVLSDIYTGRVLHDTERPDLRRELKPSAPTALEPSQYRTEGQAFSTRPGPLTAGTRINPLTGETEPRAFPKTYGCDGGVDYGDFYTLRSGTAAFYDKTAESGTVFLSGPRSGCTNSVIPSGGLLNVPYYYDGCTCSYPLPVAMSLVAMPESHEQWASWGATKIEPGKIQRVGINFGAPGDRITRATPVTPVTPIGTLWLDYPSVGGPSPELETEATPETRYRYRHSLWMRGDHPYPWVGASLAEGLERFVIRGLKPGAYTVRLYFAEPDEHGPGARRMDVVLQGQPIARGLNVAAEAGGVMRSYVKEVTDVKIDNSLTLELAASKGQTMISGLELIRQN